MRLLRVGKTTDQGKVRLEGVIHTDSRSSEESVWFEYDADFEDYVVETADPFLPILMLAAMASGETLVVEPPLSEALYHNAIDLQETYTTWYPELRRVEIIARELRSDHHANSTANTASFFSAGVDSFYTLLRHREQHGPERPAITHLITMQGYEQPLSKDITAAARERLVRQISEKLGVSLIFGRSNWRDVLNTDVCYMLGASLASAAHSLAGGLSTVYVPSTHHWSFLPVYGTSPLIDTRWSKAHLALRHDGCEATRLDKILYSLEHDEQLFLDNVYSCMRVRDDNMNCGGCFRCIRILCTLAVLGKLDRAMRFADPFPKYFERRFIERRLGKATPTLQSEYNFARDNYRLSAAHGHPDPRVRKFLERFMAKAERELLRRRKAELAWRKQPRNEHFGAGKKRSGECA